MKHWKTVREFKKLLRGGDISPEQVCFTAMSIKGLEYTIATMQREGTGCRIVVVMLPEEKETEDRQTKLGIDILMERVGELEGKVMAIEARQAAPKQPKRKLVMNKEEREESE